MSPFVKKQVLPVVIPIGLLSAACWLGGILLMFRTAGLMIAVTNSYLIYVAFRPGAFIRGAGFNFMIFLMVIVIATGLAMVGPTAPALLDYELKHLR